MGAMVSMASLAQEEDVTKYIQNAGFDEDLTFQVDGTMKEAVNTSTSLSDRSWAYIAADSTVYARPKTTSGQNRPDGRKMEAVNGFKGRVKGWTMESNSEFPKCEWTYFGSVPYDLQAQSVPIADDGTTYLEVPARPTEFDGGEGFVYLRAGWTNSAIYKQVVKLPCAVYRLEYWTININPNTSAVAADLTQIQCRKDVFKDEEGTGLNAQEWTKHEFEFTPTAEFTMQFGYQAANAGSGGQPIVALDGIKLYRIGDADPIALLKSDLQDFNAQCSEMSGLASSEKFNGLADVISDYTWEIEDMTMLTTQEEMEEGIKTVKARMEQFQQAIDEMANINAILTKMDKLLQTTDYAGKAELEAAYQRILGYKENGAEEGVDIVAQILGAVEEGEAAIKAYYLSQKASVDSPADYTFFIQHPWFIDPKAEPELKDGVWEYPLRYNEEDGSDRYVLGSASSPDLNSTGWYISGASGGDQRLNFQCDRSCWNAWNSNFTTTIAVAQDIEGLPNGYYTVSADLITQSGYTNGTQRVFAQSVAEKKVSEKALEAEGWDYNEWETVAMTAEEKVLVVDGKLTIGAQGTGDGNASAGWFLATNFHLYYLGEAPADAAKEALAAKVAAANELIEAVKFAGDKKALNDSIDKYGAYTDYVEGLTGLAAAMSEAQKSIDKYEEYLPEDGTIEGKTLPTVMYTLSKNGGEGYGFAEAIVEYAYDYVMNWVKNDTASYKYFDAQVDLLKNYLNTYTPVYNSAAETALTTSDKAKAAIEALMAEQKTALTSEMKDKATVDEFVKALNAIVALAQKQDIYDNPNATDYTAYIQNPNAEAVDGWTFVMGNGDGNGEKSGQWLDGSNTRYFDTYNGSGLSGFIATQLITGLPNGTYNVGVYARTPAEGAYVLYAPAADTTYVEIPLHYYQTLTEAGEDTTVVASDSHGPIWEEAKEAYEAGTYTDEQYNIYNTNLVEGEPIGRGWKHMEINGIQVTDHQLLIGTAAGSEALKTEKVFGGNWYSVGGWTLTQMSKGDNTGWDGPIAAGIVTVGNSQKQADGIYTISGVKTGRMQRGLNIVVIDGKAHKVLVK